MSLNIGNHVDQQGVTSTTATAPQEMASPNQSGSPMQSSSSSSQNVKGTANDTSANQVRFTLILLKLDITLLIPHFRFLQNRDYRNWYVK